MTIFFLETRYGLNRRFFRLSFSRADFIVFVIEKEKLVEVDIDGNEELIEIDIVVEKFHPRIGPDALPPDLCGIFLWWLLLLFFRWTGFLRIIFWLFLGRFIRLASLSRGRRVFFHLAHFSLAFSRWSRATWLRFWIRSPAFFRRFLIACATEIIGLTA